MVVLRVWDGIPECCILSDWVLSRVRPFTFFTFFWFTAAAGFGAFWVGGKTASLFGRSADLKGWVVAILGGLLTTGLGIAVGGNFVAPIAGTWFGPLLFGRLLIDYPALWLVWATGLVAVNLYALSLRGGSQFKCDFSDLE